MDNNEELPSFENYQVLRELGRGGMGVVYLAEDKRLNRQVALKVIHAAKVHSISKDQIINEAKILANLNHANIVHLYDIVEEHDSIALVMEYVDGIDLKRAIVEQYASLEQKIIWLRQIAQALEYAHDHNILHRDIKPENILVSNSNIAKLSDFGISEVISGTHTRSFKEHSQNKSEKFSSLLTLAPEEINGASVDTKSDLFSLGCVCYTLLCGKHPFVTGSVINKNEIIKNILHNEPINPKDFNPNIPAEICTLVVSLLQKDKSKRPLNAVDVVGRLVAHEKNPNGLDDVDLTETLPTSELYKAPTGFPAWLKSTLAMLVVVVCCVAGYWIYDSRPIEKKYVAIYEPALWDSEGVSDIEKDLYLSASVWIREYLLAHPNVSVLETSVAEKPGISIEDFFKRTAADEVVTSYLKCQEYSCNISVRNVDSDFNEIISEVNGRFVFSDFSEINNIVRKFVLSSYGSEFLDDRGFEAVISDENFDEYLSIYKGSLSGSIDSKELIFRLEKLHVKEPHFSGLYTIWVNTLLQLFNDSLDELYLNNLAQVIKYEEKFGLNNVVVTNHKVLLNLHTRDYEKALSLIRELEVAGAESEDVLANYALYYQSVGDYNLAAEYYERLIQYRPSYKYYYNASLNYWWASEYDLMEKNLTLLLGLVPDSEIGLKLSAASNLSLGKLEVARNKYFKLLNGSFDGETLNNIGLTYLLNGDFIDAKEYFKQAVKKSPEDIISNLNLGESYILTENRPLAIEYFDKVIDLTENNNDINYVLVRAQTLAHLKRFDEAIKLIRPLEKSNNNDSEILYTASIVYSLAGEQYSALTTVELALKNGLGQIWLNLPWFDSVCDLLYTRKVISDSIDCSYKT